MYIYVIMPTNHERTYEPLMETLRDRKKKTRRERRERVLRSEKQEVSESRDRGVESL